MNSSLMSFKRQGFPLRKYDELPSRVSRRVMATSSLSMPSCAPTWSSTKVTSANAIPRRVAQPLKITSVMSSPRRALADCSPITHLMESTMFDLPQPLGPMTAVIPSSKSKVMRSANDLKPNVSNRFRRMRTLRRGRRLGRLERGQGCARGDGARRFAHYSS